MVQKVDASMLWHPIFQEMNVDWSGLSTNKSTGNTMPSFAFDAALAHALRATQWAGLRYSRESTQHRAVRNDAPEKNMTTIEAGVMCEVLMDGHFGYAATGDLSRAGLQQAFDTAIATTRTKSRHKVHTFTDAHRAAVQGAYESPTQIKLAQTKLALITECLLAASRAMEIDAKIVNRQVGTKVIQTQIDYFSSNGSRTSQHFDMVDVELTATAVEGLQSQSRSWSLIGQHGGEVFVPTVLAQQGLRVANDALELLAAPNCPYGPMNLILMSHELKLYFPRFTASEGSPAFWVHLDTTLRQSHLP